MASLEIHLQPCGYRAQDQICGHFGVCVRSHKVLLTKMLLVHQKCDLNLLLSILYFFDIAISIVFFSISHCNIIALCFIFDISSLYYTYLLNKY